MSVTFFKYGYKGKKEANLSLGKLTLRISRHQFALWLNYKPLFNLLF